MFQAAERDGIGQGRSVLGSEPGQSSASSGHQPQQTASPPGNAADAGPPADSRRRPLPPQPWSKGSSDYGALRPVEGPGPGLSLGLKAESQDKFLRAIPHKLSANPPIICFDLETLGATSPKSESRSRADSTYIADVQRSAVVGVGDSICTFHKILVQKEPHCSAMTTGSSFQGFEPVHTVLSFGLQDICYSVRRPLSAILLLPLQLEVYCIAMTGLATGFMPCTRAASMCECTTARFLTRHMLSVRRLSLGCGGIGQCNRG